MDGAKPWAYRPQQHDDWGVMRDADGDLAARALGPEFHDAYLCEVHRLASTDPVEKRAREIVRAVNCHDDLVAALKAITDHFAAVMSGPLVSGFVTFANGVEGIPTIVDARAALAKVEQST